MLPQDPCITLALNEIQQKNQKSTAHILATETLVFQEGEPHIARVDRDEADGSVILYFALENHSYFLMMQVDMLPEPSLRGVSIAAGTQCHLVSFSTSHPLSTLLAATCITPTQQWDLDAGGGSSGFYMEQAMPLADSLDDNIAVLLTILEQDIAGIGKLSSLANTFIQAYWYGPADHKLPSIRLKPKTLQRMAALNLAIDFDLYSN
jgi:hypothetical protein